MLNLGIRRRDKGEGAGGRGFSPGVILCLAVAGLAAFGGLILVTTGMTDADTIFGLVLIAAAILVGALGLAFEERRAIKRAITQNRLAGEARSEPRDRARQRAP